MEALGGVVLRPKVRYSRRVGTRWRRIRKETYSPSGRPMPPRLALWSRNNIPLRAGATMDELLKRFWPDLIDRLHGPLTFRLILQPLSAAFIAFRAGLRDARAGRPAYGWAMLTNRADRLALLKEGWRELTPGLRVGGGSGSDLRNDRLSRNSPGSVPGCGGAAGTVALPFIPRPGEPDHPALAPQPWTAGLKSRKRTDWEPLRLRHVRSLRDIDGCQKK